jgi:hypothetical protein
MSYIIGFVFLLPALAVCWLILDCYLVGKSIDDERGLK